MFVKVKRVSQIKYLDSISTEHGRLDWGIETRCEKAVIFTKIFEAADGNEATNTQYLYFITLLSTSKV